MEEKEGVLADEKTTYRLEAVGEVQLRRCLAGRGLCR
jgi:hypothetical protein